MQKLFCASLLLLCDQDVEVEKQSHFATVNMKTATTAAVSVGFSSRGLLILLQHKYPRLSLRSTLQVFIIV